MECNEGGALGGLLRGKAYSPDAMGGGGGLGNAKSIGTALCAEGGFRRRLAECLLCATMVVATKGRIPF